MWKHPHFPVKTKFKTVQSPGKVMGIFSGMCIELCWLHTSWFNNKCICLSGNFKETQRGYSEKHTRIVDHRRSFAWQCSTSECCHNCESFELLGLRTCSTSTIQSWSGSIGLPSVPKDEKHSEVSDSTPVKVFKMKTRNGYVLSAPFFIWRTWQIDVSL
jgi:hypothetical protein